MHKCFSAALLNFHTVALTQELPVTIQTFPAGSATAAEWSKGQHGSAVRSPDCRFFLFLCVCVLSFRLLFRRCGAHFALDMAHLFSTSAGDILWNDFQRLPQRSVLCICRWRCNELCWSVLCGCSNNEKKKPKTLCWPEANVVVTLEKNLVLGFLKTELKTGSRQVFCFRYHYEVNLIK